MKILLAEDDINLGKLLSMLLKKQNITVNWVQDGEAAYDAVYADGYDVLVLDWMMPLLSGLDLCKRLREEDYQGKILLLTAKDTLADKVEGLNSGADDYLVKPFELEELVARLNALCRRQGQYSAEKLCYGVYTLESSTYCLHTVNAVWSCARVNLSCWSCFCVTAGRLCRVRCCRTVSGALTAM